MVTSSAKRVLIVKLSSLGDLIHALPTIHCLKVGLPASITWVVNATYAPLLEYATDVDEVIPFDRERPVRGLWGMISELRRREFDLVIDLTGLFKSALISRLARGKLCVGPSYAREFSWLFYQQQVGSRDLNRHAVERYLDVVRALGLDEGDRAFPLMFPPSSLPADGSQPVVVLIPSARWPAKLWPATSFADLAARLRREKVRVVMVGGELPSAGDPLVGLEGVIDLRGRTSLAELGAVLERADLVIANDTGPMHLAVALGRKVITLMGPTDPRRTGPYGTGHRILSTFPPCSPCFSKVCRNPAGQICLRNLPPAEVCAAAIAMLRERSADKWQRSERGVSLDPIPSTLDPSSPS